jgi:alpha-beta hydrolase superfamily lysophospholipase
MESTDNTVDIRSDTLETATHRLHRFYAVPEGPPLARVILLHGYGDHAGKYLHVLRWFAARGIAASATDFRGHGRSSGRVAHVNSWDEYLDDLKAMLAAPAGTEDRGSTFLLAHSHGGLIAIIAGLRGMLDNCSGVILSAPYLELKVPVPAGKRIAAAIASRVWPSLPFKTGIGGPMLTHDQEFIDINKTDPYCPGIATPRWFTATRKMQAKAKASAAQFKLPLFMLVAGDDVIADARASVAFYDAAASPDKELRQYPTYRHELLREVGREAIFTQILEWILNRHRPI